MNYLGRVKEEQKDADDSVEQVEVDDFDQAKAPVEMSYADIEHLEGEGSKKVKARDVDKLPEWGGRITMEAGNG